MLEIWRSVDVTVQRDSLKVLMVGILCLDSLSSLTILAKNLPSCVHTFPDICKHILNSLSSTVPSYAVPLSSHNLNRPLKAPLCYTHA